MPASYPRTGLTPPPPTGEGWPAAGRGLLASQWTRPWGRSSLAPPPSTGEGWPAVGRGVIASQWVSPWGRTGLILSVSAEGWPAAGLLGLVVKGKTGLTPAPASVEGWPAAGLGPLSTQWPAPWRMSGLTPAPVTTENWPAIGRGLPAFQWPSPWSMSGLTPSPPIAENWPATGILVTIGAPLTGLRDIVGAEIWPAAGSGLPAFQWPSPWSMSGLTPPPITSEGWPAVGFQALITALLTGLLDVVGAEGWPAAGEGTLAFQWPSPWDKAGLTPPPAIAENWPAIQIKLVSGGNHAWYYRTFILTPNRAVA